MTVNVVEDEDKVFVTWAGRYIFIYEYNRYLYMFI